MIICNIFLCIKEVNIFSQQQILIVLLEPEQPVFMPYLEVHTPAQPVFWLENPHFCMVIALQ